VQSFAEDFAKLNEDVTAWEESQDSGDNSQNRVFYLAIPPSVFGPSCTSIKASAMAPTGWTRVIVEKPFGCEHASTRKAVTAMLTATASSRATVALPIGGR
jgi:glucose-6-phosphate 1-dehydrogenase